MAIFLGRSADDNYVRVPNQWARDPQLSLKAKGLLTYLLSHQNGYELTIEQMVAECKDGKSAIYAAINELIKHGYVRREQQRTPEGKLGDTDYYVADAPVTAASRFSASRKPESGPDQEERNVSAGQTASRFSGYGKTASGKSASKKTMSKKTKVLEDEKTISLSAPVAGSPSADPPAQDRERDEDSSKNEPQDPRHQLVIRRGALIDEAPQVVALIEAEHSPRSIAWWRTVDRQGDLGDIITKALARIRAAASPEALRPPEVAPQPPHCGSCDPNRFVWVRAASGRVALAPCPTCHRKGKPLPPGASIVEGPDYQSDRPARPARQLPLCGRSVCRDGWYQLGINKVRCHICPDPNEPSTTGLGEKEATTA